MHLSSALVIVVYLRFTLHFCFLHLQPTATSSDPRKFCPAIGFMPSIRASMSQLNGSYPASPATESLYYLPQNNACPPGSAYTAVS